jgi:hypothetical protein
LLWRSFSRSSGVVAGRPRFLAEGAELMSLAAAMTPPSKNGLNHRVDQTLCGRYIGKPI